MLEKKITRKEAAIILILAAVLIGLLYYQFVYKWSRDQLAQYDTADLETELMTDQTLAMRMKNMQDEINENKAAGLGTVETYDNIKAEMDELNNIFADADSFQFSDFDQAVADGNTVRRNITASFTAGSYSEAKEMLENLYNCKYRCLIQDITISPYDRDGDDDNGLMNGAVSVSFTVTFYETIYDADTTDGLIIENSDSSDSEDLADEIRQHRITVENM